MQLPALQTSRLLLEPLRAEHAFELHSIYADAASMRWWHSPPHAGLDETRYLVEGELANAAAPSWIVRLRDRGTLIGRVDYIAAAITGMGYILGSPYWRQGYGGEAVAAALDFGFRNAGYNRVELWIHEHNIASQRLAARLGFRQRGQFRQRYQHHAAPFETQVWGMRGDEWAALTGPDGFVPPARHVAFYSVAPTIGVDDVAATVTYYVEHLGFDLDYSAGEPASFAIVGRGEWTAERVQIHFSQTASARSPERLYIRVSDADALHDELAARGVTIEQPLTTQAYGRRDFGVRDPSGVLLVFAADV